MGWWSDWAAWSMLDDAVHTASTWLLGLLRRAADRLDCPSVGPLARISFLSVDRRALKGSISASRWRPRESQHRSGRRLSHPAAAAAAACCWDWHWRTAVQTVRCYSFVLLQRSDNCPARPRRCMAERGGSTVVGPVRRSFSSVIGNRFMERVRAAAAARL